MELGAAAREERERGTPLWLKALLALAALKLLVFFAFVATIVV